MDTKDDKITTGTVQKEAWEQPLLIALDVNETESGTVDVLELGGLTGSLIES